MTQQEATAVSTAPVGKFPCSWCSERFNNNVEKYNHERTGHPEEFQERAAARVVGEQAGVQEGPNAVSSPGYSPSHQPYEDTRRIAGLHMAELHEYTKKFATSLQSAAPTMGEARKQQLILTFDNDASRYSAEPQLLDRFLTRAGLTAQQTEYIKLVMLPIDGAYPGSSGYPSGGVPGQPQAWTFDARTGQMAPIIVMGGGQPQPQQSQPNMPFIMMSPPQPQAQVDPDRMTRYDLMEFADKLATRLQPPAQEPAPQYEVPMRRFQRIVTDEDGAPVKDGDQVLMVWVEEPVVPDASGGLDKAIETLSKLGLIGQKPEPAPTADAIAETVVSKATALMPRDTGPSPEFTELSKKFDTFLAEKDRDEAVQAAVEKASTAFANQMQPMLSELENLRGRQGLSDHQADLVHQQDMQKTFISGLNTTLAGFRSDLQPMFIQNMVAQMKALGLQEGTIADLVSRVGMRAPVEDTDPVGARADVLKRWVTT